MKYGTCSLCGQEIMEAESRDRQEQWVGWHPILGRKGGGAHTKGRFPHQTGAVAHGKCVDEAHRKQKLGVPHENLGLF